MPSATVQVVCDDPQIKILDNFASPEECAAILRIAEQQLGPPLVSGEELGEDKTVRTGDLAWLLHDHDPTVEMLCMRVAGVLNQPLTNAEQLQVVRYHPGQRYLAHFDSYDRSTRVGKRCTARGGQRIATALLYLHPPEAGGATRFPRLELTVDPLLGRLLVFQNCGDNTQEPHPLSLHAGEPVDAGVKWIANLWFRERAWRGLDAWVDD